MHGYWLNVLHWINGQCLIKCSFAQMELLHDHDYMYVNGGTVAQSTYASARLTRAYLRFWSSLLYSKIHIHINWLKIINWLSWKLMYDVKIILGNQNPYATLPYQIQNSAQCIFKH